MLAFIGASRKGWGSASAEHGNRVQSPGVNTTLRVCKRYTVRTGSVRTVRICTIVRSSAEQSCAKSDNTYYVE
jgi:hypothetical protein